MVRVIPVNIQNFKLFAFLLLEIMISQKFPFQKETSSWNSIFTPEIEQNSKELLFIPENIFSCTWF